MKHTVGLARPAFTLIGSISKTNKQTQRERQNNKQSWKREREKIWIRHQQSGEREGGRGKGGAGKKYETIRRGRSEAERDVFHTALQNY